MQFSPKKQELYLSYLRNHLQKSIQKGGITQKRLCKIKKIELFSIISKKPVEAPLDLFLFCNVILYSLQALVFLKNKSFRINIEGNGIFLCCKKTLCAILCQTAILACNDGFINVELLRSGMKICYTGSTPDCTLKKLINKLNGTILCVKDRNLFLIFIPLRLCDEKSEKITGAVSLLTDPLSEIKIFTADLI